MSQSKEIERKWQVLDFTLDLLSGRGAMRTHIVQTYLVCRGPGERRVRQASADHRTAYTYTEKLPTGERGTRVENEKTITQAEYERLLLEQDPATESIIKVRHRFQYAGHLLELDVYAGSLAGLVVLEVELQNIDEPIELPPGWEVAEVTDDPQFKNRTLAAKPSV